MVPQMSYRKRGPDYRFLIPFYFMFLMKILSGYLVLYNQKSVYCALNKAEVTLQKSVFVMLKLQCCSFHYSK